MILFLTLSPDRAECILAARRSKSALSGDKAR